MDDIEAVAMKVLVTPSAIDFGFGIVTETERSGLNPELGGMDRYPYRPGSRFGILV
jgi:hypothetical protein